jgi:hypothetical protein
VRYVHHTPKEAQAAGRIYPEKTIAMTCSRVKLGRRLLLQSIAPALSSPGLTGRSSNHQILGRGKVPTTSAAQGLLDCPF